MFQPISFTVLRQCLKKMGIPIPTMRVLSSYEDDQHIQHAEYLLSFAMPAVQTWLVKRGLMVNLAGYSHFKDAVQSSFSTDVTVLDEYHNENPHVVGLMIHLRVPPRLRQMELGE